MRDLERLPIPSLTQRQELVQEFCYVPPGVPTFTDGGYELKVYDLDATFQKGSPVVMSVNCYPSNIDFFLLQGEDFVKDPLVVHDVVKKRYKNKHRELDEQYAEDSLNYSSFFNNVGVELPHHLNTEFDDNRFAAVHYRDMGQTSVDFCDGITWARLYPDLDPETRSLKYPVIVLDALLRDMFEISRSDQVFSMKFDYIASAVIEIAVELSAVASEKINAP